MTLEWWIRVELRAPWLCKSSMFFLTYLFLEKLYGWHRTELLQSTILVEKISTQTDCDNGSKILSEMQGLRKFHNITLHSAPCAPGYITEIYTYIVSPTCCMCNMDRVRQTLVGLRFNTMYLREGEIACVFSEGEHACICSLTNINTFHGRPTVERPIPLNMDINGASGR